MLLNGRHILVTIQLFFFLFSGKKVKKNSSDKDLKIIFIYGLQRMNLKKTGKHHAHEQERTRVYLPLDVAKLVRYLYATLFHIENGFI